MSTGPPNPEGSEDARPLAVEWVDPGSVADDWVALAAETRAPPFARPAWVEAWWDAFGEGDGRRVAVVRDHAGRAVALAPAHSVPHGLAMPQNDHAPWLPWIARDRAALTALTGAVLAAAGAHLLVRFVPRSGSTHRAIMGSARRRGARTLGLGHNESPVLSLEALADPEMVLSGRRRRDMHRRDRRLAEMGDVEVLVHRSPAGLDRLIDECFAIEATQWKGSAGMAMASRPETAGYYRRIAHVAAAEGSLRLVHLRLDGRMVAFGLGAAGPDAYYPLKTGFDAAVARMSPGQMIVRREIAQAIEDDLDLFEFLGPTEPYKLIWTPERVRRDDLLVYRRRPAGYRALVRLRIIPGVRRRLGRG